MTPPHAHPCNFRLHRVLDRGWGELACEYRWDSTGVTTSRNCDELPGLEHCFLYEFTTYSEGTSEASPGWFTAPTPPFAHWRFRNPTDGRTAPVGMERFSAAQGWAWDRHKLAGSLILPDESGCWTICAIQRYCFHCEICGIETSVEGPDGGPHPIVRTFSAVSDGSPGFNGLRGRYTILKHGFSAWMEIAADGYVADSADIGFGPSGLIADARAGASKGPHDLAGW